MNMLAATGTMHWSNFIFVHLRTYYILLLGCLALIQPSLSQAPFDYDNQCRTSFRYAAQHIFPDNVKILLDSYDYENLLNNGDDNIWESVGYDGDSVNVS